MEPFDFQSELFDIRNDVLQELANNGIQWLSDFGALDLQHDTFGIEVTGIRNKNLAKSIEMILRAKLPEWGHYETYYEGQNKAEIGWKVTISKKGDVQTRFFDRKSSPIFNRFNSVVSSLLFGAIKAFRHFLFGRK